MVLIKSRSRRPAPDHAVFLALKHVVLAVSIARVVTSHHVRSAQTERGKVRRPMVRKSMVESLWRVVDLREVPMVLGLRKRVKLWRDWTRRCGRCEQLDSVVLAAALDSLVAVLVQVGKVLPEFSVLL